MKRVLVRFAIQQSLAIIIPLFLFCINAGIANESTLVMALLLICNFIAQLKCYSIQPELFSERLKKPKTIKTWDAFISLAVSLLLYAQYIIAGLCLRYSITSFDIIFSPFIIIGGACLYLLAILLSSRAMIANPYYSTFVCIQSDRGHRVIQTGPYRWVRHPGYLALLIQYFSLPLIFNAWILFGFSLVLASLLLVRTINEDSFLSAELEGYKNYQTLVRARIIPFVI
jgi:protein-S-isoprenylcysteine O-methyltransferase Ste14